MKLVRAICTVGIVAMMAFPLFADDEAPKDEAPQEIEARTVLEGLDNPCGVTTQPETGDVLVSDSGAGRVIRVVDGQAQDVITDFPADIYGKGPMYNIGPLGLAFLSKERVGGKKERSKARLARQDDSKKEGFGIIFFSLETALPSSHYMESVVVPHVELSHFIYHE